MQEVKVQPGVTAVNQPRTLFKPGSWLEQIDFINHLILFNNVLITLVSEKDGGKTTFNTLLQNNLDAQIQFISMTPTAHCDQQSILDTMCSQLNIINSELTHLDYIVKHINAGNTHVLVIIDDAHNLPESFIKEAMAVIKNQPVLGLFHLCLISDHSILDTLNHLSVDQYNNLIHTIELGSLNENETRTYILQKAMIARLINKPLVDEQYKQFYHQTKGNISKINSNLGSYLSQCTNATNNNKKPFFKRFSKLLSLVVAIGFFYMTYGKLNTSRSIHQTAMTESFQTEIKKNLAKEQEPLESYIVSWQVPTVPKVEVDTISNSSSSDSYIASMSCPHNVFGSNQFNTYSSWQKHESLTQSNAHENLSSQTNLGSVDNWPTHCVGPTCRGLSAGSMDPADKPREVGLGNNAPHNTLVKAPEKIIKKNAEKSVSNKYTIQLVASHKVHDISLFKKSNRLFADAKIRRFSNAQGMWYVLTLGEFDSMSTAKQSIQKLPASLIQLNPWVRAVSGLNSLS